MCFMKIYIVSREYAQKMLRPQIGLLEGFSDGDRHNSPTIHAKKKMRKNSLYTKALATTLDGSHKNLTSLRQYRKS